jgi:hypothetical protein
MLKTSILAAATIVMLGAASAAYASDHENQSGGFDIGPLGQCFVPPDCGQGQAARAQARWRGFSGYANAPDRWYHQERGAHHAR